MTSALPSPAFVFTDVVPRVWSPLVFPHEVCVRVSGVHASVFCCSAFFLHLSLQARRGSHAESNSVILGIDPASSDVNVGFRGICQGQYLLHSY